MHAPRPSIPRLVLLAASALGASLIAIGCGDDGDSTTETSSASVSYTHLTLPTILRV